MASGTTKLMKLTEARAHFSEIVAEVHRDGTRVDITKAGIPVATIISTSDMERFKRLEAEREKDFAILDEIGASLVDVPWEEIEAQADRAVAKLRAERRAEQMATGPAADRRAVAEAASDDYDATGEASQPAEQGRRGVA